MRYLSVLFVTTSPVQHASASVDPRNGFLIAIDLCVFGSLHFLNKFIFPAPLSKREKFNTDFNGSMATYFYKPEGWGSRHLVFCSPPCRKWKARLSSRSWGHSCRSQKSHRCRHLHFRQCVSRCGCLEGAHTGQLGGVGAEEEIIREVILTDVLFTYQMADSHNAKPQCRWHQPNIIPLANSNGGTDGSKDTQGLYHLT